MAQEIGRIQRPDVERYRGRRKLLLVPLIYAPRMDDEEGATLLQRYWDEMQTQVASLADALGGLDHVYHESLTESGSQGLEYLTAVDQRSHSFVEKKVQDGATLEATEDQELLAETLDLQRFLMAPLSSQKVALKLREWYSESNKSRYEHIAERIDATLGEGQVGLLMISEGHQVQFPGDIEVFYVSPPALDDFRSWLQRWVVRQQEMRQGSGQGSGQEQETGQEQEAGQEIEAALENEDVAPEGEETGGTTG